MMGWVRGRTVVRCALVWALLGLWSCTEEDVVNRPGPDWGADEDATVQAPPDVSDAPDADVRPEDVGTSDATGGADDPDVAPPDSDDDPAMPGPDASDVRDPAPDVLPPPALEEVEVGHTRELRGVWIATAWGINFPSRQGLSADALRGELRAHVELVRDVGLNAIFFQVRPEGDAFYDSTLEPWSRFLTGTQGGDPGFDPLAFLIEEAHRHAIEVHAWLNPYRARTSLSSVLAEGHMARTWPDVAYTYGSGTWMDPGSEPVRQRLLDVVADLVERYHLDGIHFDDYFYPYPVSGAEFPDGSTFAAYQQSGGTLTRDNWRRDNVNRMVRDVHATVAALDPAVRFGVSPFGIYRPGHPPGIRGLDAWASLFADPLVWMREGWVDYVAPQLYWPSTRTAQAYAPLLAWWLEQEGDRWVVPGNYLSQLGTASDWTVDEFREQVRLTRSGAGGRAAGNIWYQIAPLQQNLSGIADVFRNEFYPTPALPPVQRSAPTSPLAAPEVTSVDTDTLQVQHTSPGDLFAWTLYRQEGGEWVLDAVLSGAQRTLMRPQGGVWALAAVHRDGRESVGVVLP